MIKQKTIVNFILDESGSMQSVKDSTVSGFNEYISTLKKDKKSDYEFTLTLFNTVTRQPILKKAIGEVGKLDFSPDGMTALYDAVCTTIKGVKEKKNQKVITVIMTDGEENSSKEYSEKDMKALIKEREGKGNWTFVYLGANQDSYKVAQKYGISTMNVSNYNATGAGVSATMRSVASNTVMYAASATSSTQDFFSKEDQDLLNKTK
jgi:hypothetical protein